MNPRQILISASVLLCSLVTHATASDWGIYGATICGAPADRSTNTSWSLAAPDGAGGAYMGWSDNRSGTPRVFLQRVTSGGGPAPGWPFHGIPASSFTPIRQIRPALAGDPAGGVFMVWLEGEDSWENPGHEVRIARLGEGGAPKPSWPASGVVVATSALSNSDPAVVPDASGGAYVMWLSPSDAQTYSFRLHHVLGNGGLDPLWPADGSIVGESTDLFAPAIAADGMGGVLVAWNESRFPEVGFHYRAQRILVGGAPAPGWDPNGTLIRTTSTPNNTWRAPKIVPDGTGGAIVAFREFKEGGEHFGVYVRRVASNGSFAGGWASEGTPVSTTPPAAGRFAMVPDGVSGAILFWEAFEEAVFPPWRIWAQRLDANGSVPTGWPADGRRIGSADRYSLNPIGLGDGVGGAFVAWAEPTATGYERLHVHHVKADGSDAAGWGPEGAELAPGSPNDHTQTDVSLASRGNEGIFAFWSDYPIPASEIKVLGQLFDPAPPTDVGPPPSGSAKGLRVQPNPAFSKVQVHLLASTRVSSVAIHDLAGRRVRTLSEQFIAFPGGYPWTWDLRDDDGRRVSPGIYRVVARHDDGIESTSVVVLR